MEFNKITYSQRSKSIMMLTAIGPRPYKGQVLKGDSIHPTGPPKNVDMEDINEDKQLPLKNGTQKSKVKPKEEKNYRKDKLYYCSFCKMKTVRFWEHMSSKHKKDKQIKAILDISNGLLKRQEINKIRIKMMADYNEQVNSEEMTYRSKGISRTRCPNCRITVSKKNLSRHIIKCKVVNLSLKAALLTREEVLDQRMDSILQKGHQDELMQQLKNDTLMMAFVKEMVQNDAFNANDIRSKVRGVTRIYMKMKKEDSTIINLCDIFEKKHWRLLVEAINKEAEYDPDSNYKRASVALNIGYTFNKIANTLHRELFMADKETDSVKGWLFCYESSYYNHVAKNAKQVISEKKRENRKELPKDEDIKKLLTYVNQVMLNSTKKLESKFDYKTWLDLGKSILVGLLTYNRRRVSEMSKLKINDVKNKHMINKDSIYYKNLTDTEKYLSNTFYRVELTGKRGRNVHILVNFQVAKCVEVFMNNQRNAEVPSTKYVFASKSGKNISASSALAMFSKHCDAAKPEALRSTLLRKSIASFTQLLSMTNTDMHNFAGLMGHNYNINHDFYKVADDITQITRLNKVLIMANNNEAHKVVGMELDKIQPQIFEEPDPDSELEEDDSDKEDESIESKEIVSDSSGDKIESDVDQTRTLRRKKNAKTIVHNSSAEEDDSDADTSWYPEGKPRNKFPNPKNMLGEYKGSRVLTPSKRNKRKWSQEEKELLTKHFAKNIIEKVGISHDDARHFRKKYSFLPYRISNQIVSKIGNIIRNKK